MKLKVGKSYRRISILALLLFSHSAKSEIEVTGEANTFYTSDVSLFSASQRLNKTKAEK